MSLGKKKTIFILLIVDARRKNSNHDYCCSDQEYLDKVVIELEYDQVTELCRSFIKK